jgi:hypothetical protein
MDPKNFSEKMTRYGLRKASPSEPVDDAGQTRVASPETTERE